MDPTSMSIELDSLLQQSIKGSELDVALITKALHQANESIFQRYDDGIAIDILVSQKAKIVDHILDFCFNHLITVVKPLSSLVAVGGYGRSELLPGSDIDLMILLGNKPGRDIEQQISSFLTFLWDIGLEVGHSVRTVKDCVREGKLDVTVMTNMIESRLITGSDNIYTEFQAAIDPLKIWPAKDFFEAKLEEQQNRHLRYNDTAYNLEPNIKEGPGGLRDIQIIGWVAKRHFNANFFRELVDHQFLTEAEYDLLQKGQRHLWKVRFALHRLAGRREDRLLFDYQNQLATDFGFEAGEHNLAIEQFMQQYYRTIMELERLNEMLLQMFREEILLTRSEKESHPVNARFNLRNRFIEVSDADVFKREPSALVEIFLLISTHEECDGVTASTIRLIREHLYLVNDDFRHNSRVNELFMQLMSAPNGMTHQMRRMNSYGFLAAYIPAFARITGRMQYDLFHAYTVDQHTIFVIRNLRRFALKKHQAEFPFCNEVYTRLENPTLLYIAALFHDIAKGRGGDHSVLGSEDAINFCEQHSLNSKETRVVSQLVRHHLMMSVTAQRKDISDPDVVRDFAQQVGSIDMLNYLYLLTVSDIRSTNPKQWNNWKDALLKQLFHATHQVIRRGIDKPLELDKIIQENREAAYGAMTDLPFDRSAIDSICVQLPDDYFLRHHPLEIRWHIDTLLANPGVNTLVSTRLASNTRNTKIFVYCDECPHVFSQVTGTLGSLGLSILNAEIFTTRDDKVMDTFIIQDQNNEAITNPETIALIEKRLLTALKKGGVYRVTNNTRRPRQLKAFNHPTIIDFQQDHLNQRTVMEISSMDTPGLLSVIANVIAILEINITHAKISTLGEKIDDIFYLTTPEGTPITNETQLNELRDHMTDALDAQKAA
jgi:[protein-PII] uridylyltransferase